MLASLLIANRGEIACRIARTARRLGVRTIAVYSEADARAPHVRAADEAVCIGPPPARESYLDGGKIVAAAKHAGAEAIHPGYGFLSENAGFAEACAAAGLIFVGPPPSAIRAMGGKSEAKALMVKAGVPVVPGYHGEDQGEAALLAEAKRIGWPVLIKASAGGGGKGMKVAADAASFAAGVESARREALAAFGDGKLLVEKYLERPRHVEIQVFADTHGNCISLFERDCSIQRRHQKVIEEAPAPGLSPDMRRRMGEAAVAAARSIGYLGAGTVEFLLGAGGGFHFMEMNTRLQVEHPVTECITGLDLVEWQLRVASGEPLPLTQEAVTLSGHAFEARIYAEDPDRDFLPQTGTLHHLRFPAEAGGVRIDSGVEEGQTVQRHYDPMLAKLIVWDGDRESARRRLVEALGETRIAGVAVNVSYLSRIARHPAFALGEIDTGFIARHAGGLGPPEGAEAAARLAALGLYAARRRDAATASDPWKQCTGWRLNGRGRDHATLAASGGKRFRIAFAQEGDALAFENGGAAVSAALDADGTLTVTGGGGASSAGWHRTGDAITVFAGGETRRFTLIERELAAQSSGNAERGIRAPMPGSIVAVNVSPGTAVKTGAPLLTLEAMKMEHTLKAPRDATVEAVLCRPGDQVSEGRELLRFAADP